MPTSIRRAYRSDSDPLSASQADLMTKHLESEQPESLHEYIKAGRTDPLVLMPEMTMSKALGRVAKLREFAHIIRPLLYASLYIYGGRGSKRRWTAWTLSLLLEIFSSWPEIQSVILNRSTPNRSVIEKDEDRSRLIRLALFPLRQPFYAWGTKDRLEDLKASLSEWKLLRPLVETASTYQKLCELVHFYTSSG